MCICLILGSTGQLPILKYAPYEDDKTDRHIYVRSSGKAKNRDERAIFPNRNLYIISSRHTGDGCGFLGNWDIAVNARQDLATFLEQSLKFVSDLQLFIAWHDFGESGVIPSRFDQIGPSDIRTWVEHFNPNDFFQLIGED